MSDPVQSQARVYPLGDRVIVVELGEDASEATAVRDPNGAAFRCSGTTAATAATGCTGTYSGGW